MAPMIQVMGPDGLKVYSVYNDSREMVAGFDAGELKIGDEVIYRGNVCEVLCEFTDVDGVKYMELLFKGGLGSNIQFQFM